jgi:transcription initiation factor IIE alpha subunit
MMVCGKILFALHKEFEMYNALVLENIKKHGQRCDREIADETGISLIQVRSSITELESIKAISSCNITNFEDGVAIEGMLCRVSGYIPPAAPGRKSTPKH